MLKTRLQLFIASGEFHRVILRILIAAAILGLLIVTYRLTQPIFYLIPSSPWTYTAQLPIHSDPEVITPLIAEHLRHVEWVGYSSIQIRAESIDAFYGAKVFLGLRLLAEYLFYIVALIAVLVISRSLYLGKNFVRRATIWVSFVGVFAIVNSMLLPWLERSEIESATNEVGRISTDHPEFFPLSGGGGLAYGLPETVWSLAGIGFLLLLLGALLFGGERLQRDQEGLV